MRLVPRMTTQRWMIVIATVALACAATVILTERSRRFERIARQHSEQVRLFNWHDLAWRNQPDIRGFMARSGRLRVWHEEMARKYESAARYPWLPVEPDRPEP